MITAQHTAIEQIKLSARTLHAIANNCQDWQDAEAIHAEAGRLIEQAEALELDVQPKSTDGELLAA